MSYFENLNVVRARSQYDSQSNSVHWAVDCSGCGSKRMLAVASGTLPEKFDGLAHYSDYSAWLMCVACGMGAFAVGTSTRAYKVFPQPEPFDTPEHLSQDVAHTWGEALSSFTASAFTSCALMCRKIIFHMAVEAGLPEKNDKGWAPSFEQCVDHLVEVGHITKRQKSQWVDSIRKWGNTATHDLEPIEEATAFSALEFTFQLLQMVYVFPNAAPGSSKELEAKPKMTAIPASSGNPAIPGSASSLIE